MIDTAPPPAIISTAPIQAATSQNNDILIIPVENAKYNAIAQKAILDLEGALEKSNEIMAHKGKEIVLTYRGHIKTNSIEDCPEVRVPYTDISRDIQFLSNTVTLTISNIEQELADKISAAHCLNVDSYTVKKVVNPDFDKILDETLNP